MNKEQLHNFIETSTGNESNICQIYAIKDGKTVYEDNWCGFATEDAMNVNSVTKGVMGLLAGIAIDQGCIKSVDQKVMDFFPDYEVKRGEKTIYVNKEKNVSVGMTGTFKPRIFDRVEFIEKKVLPLLS